MCGVSLTHLILFYVETFYYTPLTDLCGDFSLTCPFLFYVGSFSYTPLCCFIWGVPLTRPILFYVGSFFYMAHAVLCGEFLLHTQCCFIGGAGGGVLFHYWCLFLCMKFVFHALCYFISGISPLEFLFHTLRKFMWGDFPIACRVFFRVKIFIYTSHSVLCEKYLIIIHALS